MNTLILFLSVFAVVLMFIVYALLWALLRSNSRLIEVNKQLLILIAGREGRPEQAGATMRALVASDKPPRGKLRGIAGDKKKKDDKTKNTNYTMEIGVTNGL